MNHIASNGEVLNEMDLPAANKSASVVTEDDHYVKSFDENERDHIIKTVRRCNTKIA